MQKRLVLVCEDFLCPRKQPDVNGPGLGEAGHYNGSKYCLLTSKANVVHFSFQGLMTSSLTSALKLIRGPLCQLVHYLLVLNAFKKICIIREIKLLLKILSI